ncbi:MAG TPA: flavin reductase family protein [Polyangiaceae bacterium LLY-WYZ-15_(1-7)]|nr:flavin reductase [Myxococcales bacterium]MAT25260.1 flavin reductase [Sandaracinus sp.]HJL03522.1 flavin reductase family protein [Polyangiaceae bacterium LLY-WYZ-15_(1-7)]MBJ70671.1 flavin reductase [Sandaracinus sp.]HJL09436.1 flavin reductase family protein [Polyangiaceae bacterium LLY-WYZ-15_(1-7)]
MSELVDKEAFTQAMRRWASGVTILTSCADGEIHGMTVSAFSSVSADPPLVLVCANQSSTTHGVIQAGGIFAVNILAADQDELSTRFAFTDAAERFEGVPWTQGSTGAPLLVGSLVQVECRVRSAHLEGSHCIYIGEVLHTFVRADAEPLLYFDGAYRRLAPKA